MKYSVLCCAIGVALIGNAVFAAPKISGTLKTELKTEKRDSVEKDLNGTVIETEHKDDRPELYGTSRIKISGSEKMGDMWTASYSLEYDFHLNKNRRGTAFSSRSTYASLEHKKFGRIRYGRHTNVDDDFSIAEGVSSLLGAEGVAYSNYSLRSNNAIQYYTPYFGENKDIRIKLHYGLDENKAANAKIDDTRVGVFKNGQGARVNRDIFGAQIAQNGKTYEWAAHYTQAGSDFYALGGGVKYYHPNDKLTLGVEARYADYHTKNKEFGAYVSAGYLFDNEWRAYGYAGSVSHRSGVKDAKIKNGAVGISKLIKTGGGAATIFGEYGVDDYYSVTGTEVKDKTSGFAIGLHHKF